MSQVCVTGCDVVLAVCWPWVVCRPSLAGFLHRGRRFTHHTIFVLAMDRPHVLLLKAAARLHSCGHSDLAQDILQLSRQWTPAEIQEVINASDPYTTNPFDR